MSWRTVYGRVADPEVYLSQGEVMQWMLAAARTRERDTGPDVARAGSLTRWIEHHRLAFQELWALAETPERERRLADVLVLQSAPLGLMLGCWLQGMSAPGVCEDEKHLALLSLLAEDLGVTRLRGARKDEFESLLRHCSSRRSLSDIDAVAQCPDIHDAMYAFPAALLAMSRRSDLFHAELCAVDFVLRSIGMLPCWETLGARFRHWIDWDRLNLQVSSDSAVVANPLACSTDIADYYRSRDAASADQFAAATEWTISAIDAWHVNMLALCRVIVDGRCAMAALVRQRAREAAVYHGSVALSGCPLSSHFRNASEDPFSLVDALSKSRFIKPGDASKSLLVNGLVSPRGPMFRVFCKDELNTIRHWIDSLPTQPERGARLPDPPTFPDEAPAALHASKDSNQTSGSRPADIREAYFLLQGRALLPATRRYACEYVATCLKRAERVDSATERSLPQSWPTGGLRLWLLEQHDLHGRDYERSTGNSGAITRDQVIESTLQLAPLILIDGSWLQGFTDIHLAGSDIGRSLFEIYWDELGNGHATLNHPRIYRELLESMGIRLAPTGSWDFAMDSRIKDDSYRLPVYWLCLGKLPSSHMPEILGMNLAMELSGVGDGYREAKVFLKEHGFSTQFVDLHNTIDNVATGHSAWAAEAVDQYMRKRSKVLSEPLVASEWRRVRNGYASLSSMPRKTNKGLLNAVRRFFAAGSRQRSMPAHFQHHHDYSRGLSR